MKIKDKILVSACLLNEPVRYNNELIQGLNPEIQKLKDQGRAVSFCPECEGGLEVPREACEIRKGDAETAFLTGTGVVSKSGTDFTKEFLKGAEMALSLCQQNGIKQALLKARSPSCGSGLVYDGTFNGKLVKGNGITTTLLLKNNIRVVDETEVEQLD